ncbi:tryptophan--tRNA ligase [Chloropicon primus]|uniref:tryptophan--tRNA ligase n=3 Tax=Chloropicon primus TaxID=1764295 RepID=A0A5B8MZ84_9CHLO|nr:tryptophan--tRNA ligase [Chloropicon primus]UPR04858.1 tryptophan--tRNA ligase [Chloropicon primus]|eukprot:QDZ25661.1 tryptophan--tRNA ligase [Chloropicon primus]
MRGMRCTSSRVVHDLSVTRRNRLLGAGCRARASSTTSEGSAGATSEGKKEERRKRVLSGAQPTGILHLGNYYGAIRNYVDLQENRDAFYTIVDLHAITVSHDPKELRESTRTTAALYLASGVDPKQATIFVQSQVKAHTELSWLLQCATPIGWLERMIQFKEKSRKLRNMEGDDEEEVKRRSQESVSTGLFTYPVLMAADILLYRADLVPVGEDQKQHIELTRDIAVRINDKYGGKKWKKRGGRGGRVLSVPEPYIPPVGARIMSLQDGTSKMSKSAENDASRINLLDTPKQIETKFKRAKTDAFEGLEFGNPERPEATNLLSIYQLATGYNKESIMRECGSMRWGEFKPKLAEAVIASLGPLQSRYNELVDDPAYLDAILKEGAEKASGVAEQTVKDVKDAMGFLI